MVAVVLLEVVAEVVLALGVHEHRQERHLAPGDLNGQSGVPETEKFVSALFYCLMLPARGTYASIMPVSSKSLAKSGPGGRARIAKVKGGRG